MDIIRLDQTTYLPDAIVEGYKSMIWTERYFETGEFELHTPRIAETMDLLPEGSLLSLSDSDEVMVVETRSIDVDSDGVPTLEITGRTFESYLNNRVITPVVYGDDWQTVRTYRADEIIAVLVWSYLVNTTGQDPAKSSGTIPSYNAINNLYITDSVNTLGSANVWWITPGSAYSMLQNIMTMFDLGIRNIRPPGDEAIQAISVDTSSSRGLISYQAVLQEQGLRLDIYDGDDRTVENSTYDPVIFSYDAGDIQDPSYLFSIKDLKNVAYVDSDTGGLTVWKKTRSSTPPSPQPEGMNVRSIFVDGGSIGDLSSTEFNEALVQKALTELAKHNRTTLFDGSISPISSYKYNRDYFLGDKVTLVAQYGFESTMRVAEYIRTEDETGDQGYPTLVLVDEEGAL